MRQIFSFTRQLGTIRDRLARLVHNLNVLCVFVRVLSPVTYLNGLPRGDSAFLSFMFLFSSYSNQRKKVTTVVVQANHKRKIFYPVLIFFMNSIFSISVVLFLLCAGNTSLNFKGLNVLFFFQCLKLMSTFLHSECTVFDISQLQLQSFFF